MFLSAGNRDNYRLGRDGGEELAEIVDMPKDTMMFGCGMDYILLYTQSGGWFGCGSNECGQLGPSEVKEFEKLTHLPALDALKPKWFVCGNNFSAIITDDGSIYAMGETYPTEIVKMKIDEPVEFAACGWNSLVILPAGKGLYFCFDGDQDLKHVCEDIHFIDCAAGMNQFVALSDAGDVYTWGEGCSCGQGDGFYSPTPQKVKLDFKVSRVYASNYDTFLVDTEDNVWVSGYNDSGMAGIGEDAEETDTFVKIPQFCTSKIAMIAGGREMNYVVTVNGEVYSAGNGEDYKLMQDNDYDVSEFKKCEKLEGKVVTYLASGSHHVIVGVDMPHLLENPVKLVPAIPTTSATAGGTNPHAEESEPASTRNGGTSKCCLLI